MLVQIQILDQQVEQQVEQQAEQQVEQQVELLMFQLPLKLYKEFLLLHLYQQEKDIKQEFSLEIGKYMEEVTNYAIPQVIN